MSGSRVPLTSAVNTAIDANAVREFVTQERSLPRPNVALPERARQGTRSALARQSRRGTMPVGLIPVTVRMSPRLAGALKRASLERQLQGESLCTQQDIVEHALEPWLREQGYLE